MGSQKKASKLPQAEVANLEQVVADFNLVIKRKARLDEAVLDVGQDGNWDWDPYMLGIYNGLIYAQSILDNKEPTYREKPANGFKCNDKAISEQLAQAVRTDLLIESEKKSEAFAKKILG